MRAATNDSAPKRKALSGQSPPSGPDVGIAGPVEQMRRVEHQKIEPGAARAQDPRAAAEQVVERAARGRTAAIAAMTAGYPGTSVAVVTPWRRKASGSAPVTSARPPVFTRG